MKFMWRVSFIAVLFTLLVVGCTANTATNQIPQDPSPVIPTPKPGKSIMTGSAYSTTNKEALSNVAVRLASVYRNESEDGAFALDIAHSPGSFTDANGIFIIEDVDPGEYLIVIGNPEDNNYVIYQDKDGQPVTYKLADGEVKDAGKLEVKFQP